MRKATRKIPQLSMVGRAVVSARWTAETWDAGIHAHLSGNPDKLVSECGKVFYVVLSVCRLTHSTKTPDCRIVAATMNAVFELAGTEVVPALAIASILSGLAAARRIYKNTSHALITKAACDLELKRMTGDVCMSDFEELEAA
jgi:hypothetical protein